MSAQGIFSSDSSAESPTASHCVGMEHLVRKPGHRAESEERLVHVHFGFGIEMLW